MPALDRRPDIEGWEWIWEAYMSLNTCRSIGMDVGPIPWTATQKYAEVHEMSPFEVRMLHRCVRAMDKSFKEKKKELNPPKTSSPKPGPKSRARKPRRPGRRR